MMSQTTGSFLFVKLAKLFLILALNGEIEIYFRSFHKLMTNVVTHYSAETNLRNLGQNRAWLIPVT